MTPVQGIDLVFQIVVLIFAFSVHEAAHAYAAFRLGDPTAYMLGRVTLNPAKHIDPWGSIVIPAMSLYFGGALIGWAKPCPITLRNFRRMKRDDILTTLAGPASNLAMALVALIVLLILKHTPGLGVDAVYAAMGLAKGVPIDTTELPRLFPIALLLYYGVVTNVLLFVFNLIPVPPLDGSRILRYVLPYNLERIYDRIGIFGSVLLFFCGYAAHPAGVLSASAERVRHDAGEPVSEPALNQDSGRKRVLSGMRPTGKLHLGNYMGALYNWVKLQHEYDCYFFIADWHALTTNYEDLSSLPGHVTSVALDFLAAGLDPERCTLFVQSAVPAHAVLALLLGMVTPLSWLERVPSYKDQQEQLREKDLATYGFLGYPLLQSADILAYQPHFVPVGLDQASHVELTREVARRFNQLYPGDFQMAPEAAPWELEAIKAKARKLAGKPDKQVFTPHELIAAAPQTKLRSAYGTHTILPEPEVLLTPSPKLPGTDGRKMSKSYGNTIELDDAEPVVRAKLKTMVTDPARVLRTDPGDPNVCPVFDLHRVFSSDAVQAAAAEGCRTAGIGCIECKQWLADGIVRELEPIQERRRFYEARPQLVLDILTAGGRKARARSEETLQQVGRVMNLYSNPEVA